MKSLEAVFIQPNNRVCFFATKKKQIQDSLSKSSNSLPKLYFHKYNILVNKFEQETQTYSIVNVVYLTYITFHSRYRCQIKSNTSRGTVGSRSVRQYAHAPASSFGTIVLKVSRVDLVPTCDSECR